MPPSSTSDRRIAPATSAFLLIIGILTLFLGTILTGALLHQAVEREDADKAHWEQSLRLAEAFVKEALLRNNFQDVIAFLKQWASEEPRILHVAAVYPTGATMFEWGHDGAPETSLFLERRIEAAGRVRLSLHLHVDMAPTRANILKSNLLVAATFMVFVFLLAVLVWAAVWTRALKPLEAERKRATEAEERARLAAHRLGHIFQTAPDGILTVDSTLVVTAFNEAAGHIFGYGPEEIVGRPLTTLLPPRAAAAHDRMTRGLIRNGGNLRAQTVQGRRSDGTIFPLQVSVSASEGDDDVAFTAIIRDRTAEVAREAQMHKLVRALDQSSNLIFITDPTGTIEFVNAMFIEVTGYSAEEAIGQTPRLLQSGATPPQVYADLWATVLEGREWRGELRDRRKDGREFWASVTITPLRDETGAVTNFVAVHEDITLRMLARQELMIAKEQAETASRAKSELLANMSHELRTPLNAVNGYSEALLLGLFGPLSDPRQEEYLRDILASGRHLLDLINDILDMSAVEAGKVDLDIGDHDIRPLITAAYRIVAPRAEVGRVALSFAAPEDAAPEDAARCVVPIDSRRLKQCMINVLSNAVKFTPPGGSVTILLEFSDEDDTVTIVVADTGVGMTPAELDIALSRFGQLDSGLNRKHEGTGLGLPLTIGLVEAMRGRLTIETYKGRGTTMRLTFPRSGGAVERSGSGAAVA